MRNESLWPRLAGLPLVIEACEYERLRAVLAYEFERITTHVGLVGAGVDGLGEDISVFREDGTALHETRPALPLEGEWTLADFCEQFATLELWSEPPEWDGALRYRRWAFESAALDLALRQAGNSLHDVLGLEPQPVRFVNSLGLGKEPSIEPVRRRLARSPGVRFKLDAEATWPPADAATRCHRFSLDGHGRLEYVTEARMPRSSSDDVPGGGRELKAVQTQATSACPSRRGGASAEGGGTRRS